jgi:hypothetical protein
MITDSARRISLFESQVRDAFAFLETERRIIFSGTRSVDGDPRDAGLVACYRADDIRVDIGWNEFELSLAVLIRLNRDELAKQARYVYLDAFVEYISGGKKQGVVPQIYPRMSEERINDAMNKRQDLFQKTSFVEILEKLAEQLRNYIGDIQNVSPEIINNYQRWFESGGKTHETWKNKENKGDATL